MDSNVIKLLFLIIPFSFSFCLKAKKSPFDVSKPSSTSGLIAAAGIKVTSSSSSTSSSTTAAPASSYSGSKTFTSLVPGESFSFDPKFTGQITSITISPAASTLPPGITFDPTTGIVSGTPTPQTSAYPQTTFTITATGPNGTVPITFDISVLGSGDNVWTKLLAGTGGNTQATSGGLIHDPISGNLYITGTTTGTSIEGMNTLETSGYNTGLLTKYTIQGEKVWTVLLGTATVVDTNINVASNYVDSAGNIYVSGTVWTNASAATFESYSIPGGSSRRLFVTKYNSAGTKLWTTVKNATTATGGYLTVDSSGNSYIAGTVLAPSMDSFTNTGWTDDGLPLVKFDTNGNWVSTRCFCWKLCKRKLGRDRSLF